MSFLLSAGVSFEGGEEEDRLACPLGFSLRGGFASPAVEDAPAVVSDESAPLEPRLGEEEVEEDLLSVCSYYSAPELLAASGEAGRCLCGCETHASVCGFSHEGICALASPPLRRSSAVVVAPSPTAIRLKPQTPAAAATVPACREQPSLGAALFSRAEKSHVLAALAPARRFGGDGGGLAAHPSALKVGVAVGPRRSSSQGNCRRSVSSLQLQGRAASGLLPEFVVREETRRRASKPPLQLGRQSAQLEKERPQQQASATALCLAAAVTERGFRTRVACAAGRRSRRGLQSPQQPPPRRGFLAAQFSAESQLLVCKRLPSLIRPRRFASLQCTAAAALRRTREDVPGVSATTALQPACSGRREEEATLSASGAAPVTRRSFSARRPSASSEKPPFAAVSEKQIEGSEATRGVQTPQQRRVRCRSAAGVSREAEATAVRCTYTPREGGFGTLSGGALAAKTSSQETLPSRERPLLKLDLEASQSLAAPESQGLAVEAFLSPRGGGFFSSRESSLTRAVCAPSDSGKAPSSPLPLETGDSLPGGKAWTAPSPPLCSSHGAAALTAELLSASRNFEEGRPPTETETEFTQQRQEQQQNFALEVAGEVGECPPSASASGSLHASVAEVVFFSPFARSCRESPRNSTPAETVSPTPLCLCEEILPDGKQEEDLHSQLWASSGAAITCRLAKQQTFEDPFFFREGNLPTEKSRQRRLVADGEETSRSTEGLVLHAKGDLKLKAEKQTQQTQRGPFCRAAAAWRSLLALTRFVKDELFSAREKAPGGRRQTNARPKTRDAVALEVSAQLCAGKGRMERGDNGTAEESSFFLPSGIQRQRRSASPGLRKRDFVNGPLNKGLALRASPNATDAATAAFEAEAAAFVEVEDEDAIPETAFWALLRVPLGLEKVIYFGAVLCFDSLLYEVTFMPVQAAGALLALAGIAVQSAAASLLAALRRGVKRLAASFRRSREAIEKRMRSLHPQRLLLGSGAQLHRRLAAAAETRASQQRSSSSDVGAACGVRTPRTALRSSSSAAVTRMPSFLPGNKPSYRNLLSSPLSVQGRCAASLSSEGEEEQALKVGVSSKSSESRESSRPDADGAHSGGRSSEEFLFPSVFTLPRTPDACALVRFSLLVLAVGVFGCVDTSRVYHLIRAQPFMKLYVIFNMLEVFEKLWRSFGRDVLDELMRTVEGMLRRRQRLARQRQQATPMPSSSSSLQPPPEKPLTASGFPLTQRSCELQLSAERPPVRQLSLPVLNSRPKETSPPERDPLCRDSSLLLRADPSEPLGQRASQTLASAVTPTRSTQRQVLPPRDSGRSGKDLWLRFFVVYCGAAVYVLLHTFMHLVRVLALTIAINSSEVSPAAVKGNNAECSLALPRCRICACYGLFSPPCF